MGYARPIPFTLFTITYKVAVYAPAERADALPVFHLYPLCTLWGVTVNLLICERHGLVVSLHKPATPEMRVQI
jgi:hypothetical protein